MNEHYVYQLRREDSQEPYYIGKGKGKRAWEHIQGHMLNTSQHNRNKAAKAKREGVEILVEFLWTDLSDEEAQRREVWAIKMWGRKDLKEGPLTNMTDGGDGMSGRIMSEETKKKIGDANRGNKRPDFAEYARTRNYKHSDETKAKISASNSKRKHSEETKAKIGAKHKGKTISKEHQEARIAAISKEYTFTDPNGERQTIKNLTEFCENNNLNRSCMTFVFKGKQKSHKGWTK
ncbi:group I intron endonuclease [Ralstonia phage RSP15]|uniref:group I intron endonuclease n=1 Tax=Ralstonia phage RSP15 TaxID=1785960 RepID=UPI00074D4902|nr:group I intron endonuclease [Ralstonia phage RSP15]BAU39993.1 group I intron endonuclease [Ralstonia phage RSP15]